MNYEYLKVRVKKRVGWLEYNYPPINAFNWDMLREVPSALQASVEMGLEEAGFVNFGIAEGGFAMFMGKKEIESTANLRQEKSWVPEGDEIAYAVYRALGVSPVVLPITDVLTGMQTGLVSTVAASPLAAVALQWHTRIKYVTDVPMSYVMGILGINKKAFNRIAPDDQAIVRQVLSESFDQINIANRADDVAARAALIKQGIIFSRPPDDVISEWRVISDQVSEQKGKEGAFDSKLAQEVAKLVSDYRKENDGKKK